MDPDSNGVERPHAEITRGFLVRVGATATVVAALGVLFGLLIHWFPTSASKQAGPIDTLWYVLVAVSVPIFVIVTTVVLMSVWKFRMRPGEENLDGPPIHGNTRLEVIWTTIPALILLVLVTYAYLVLHDIEKAPASGTEMRVLVTGQQFDWTFKYETDTTGKDIPVSEQPTTAQLYLPKGESVKFDVVSADVLHDFWVPAFRMKIDAVPGITTHYRVTPTRLGSYTVVCAELCGLGHAFMRNTAHVMPSGAFGAWFAKQRAAQKTGGGSAVAPQVDDGSGTTASAPPSTSSSTSGGGGGGSTSTTPAAGGSTSAAPAPAATPAVLADGKAVFNANGCSGCHTLADAGSNGQVGPNLDKFLPKYDAKFIQTSIVDPGAYVEKGYGAGIMPSNFGQVLNKKQLADLTTYLYTVTHK